MSEPEPRTIEELIAAGREVPDVPIASGARQRGPVSVLRERAETALELLEGAAAEDLSTPFVRGMAEFVRVLAEAALELERQLRDANDRAERWLTALATEKARAERAEARLRDMTVKVTLAEEDAQAAEADADKAEALLREIAEALAPLWKAYDKHLETGTYSALGMAAQDFLLAAREALAALPPDEETAMTDKEEGA